MSEHISDQDWTEFCVSELSFTRAEDQILFCLYKSRHEVCSYESLYKAVDGYNENPDLDIRNISSHIKRMRQKLRGHHIEVETRYGFGYVLPKSSKIIISRMISEWCLSRRDLPDIVIPERFLRLAPREIGILRVLAASSSIHSREEILDNIYGSGADILDRSVDSSIKFLRRKLEPHHLHIRSFYNIGYALTPESQVRVRELVKIWNEASGEVSRPEAEKTCRSVDAIMNQNALTGAKPLVS